MGAPVHDGPLTWSEFKSNTKTLMGVISRGTKAYVEQQFERWTPVNVKQSEADPRDFIFVFGNGERKTFHIPVPIYKGVFQARQLYGEGDVVTFKHSSWHCNVKTTQTAPGTNSDWQLMVRAGTDGKDLRS